MKILIIEKDPSLADTLTKTLRKKGFDVKCTDNREEGAQLAETGIYDLLLLNAMTPGIHTLLRDSDVQVHVLSLGNTTLNLSNSTLVCGDQSIRLSSREFDVMRYLMSSQGQILPKEMILCRVWGFNSNAVENHVEVYIGHLRKKLKQIGSNIQIETIRRLGYLMAANRNTV